MDPETAVRVLKETFNGTQALTIKVEFDPEFGFGFKMDKNNYICMRKENGKATKAGLKNLDRVISINDQKLDLDARLKNFPKSFVVENLKNFFGNEISLTIERAKPQYNTCASEKELYTSSAKNMLNEILFVQAVKIYLNSQINILERDCHYFKEKLNNIWLVFISQNGPLCITDRLECPIPDKIKYCDDISGQYWQEKIMVMYMNQIDTKIKGIAIRSISAEELEENFKRKFFSSNITFDHFWTLPVELQCQLACMYNYFYHSDSSKTKYNHLISQIPLLFMSPRFENIILSNLNKYLEKNNELDTQHKFDNLKNFVPIEGQCDHCQLNIVSFISPGLWCSVCKESFHLSGCITKSKCKDKLHPFLTLPKSWIDFKNMKGVDSNYLTEELNNKLAQLDAFKYLGQISQENLTTNFKHFVPGSHSDSASRLIGIIDDFICCQRTSLKASILLGEIYFPFLIKSDKGECVDFFKEYNLSANFQKIAMHEMSIVSSLKPLYTMVNSESGNDNIFKAANAFAGTLSRFFNKDKQRNSNYFDKVKSLLRGLTYMKHDQKCLNLLQINKELLTSIDLKLMPFSDANYDESVADYYELTSDCSFQVCFANFAEKLSRPFEIFNDFVSELESSFEKEYKGIGYLKTLVPNMEKLKRFGAEAIDEIENKEEIFRLANLLKIDADVTKICGGVDLRKLCIRNISEAAILGNTLTENLLVKLIMTDMSLIIISAANCLKMIKDPISAYREDGDVIIEPVLKYPGLELVHSETEDKEYDECHLILSRRTNKPFSIWLSFEGEEANKFLADFKNAKTSTDYE